jgi:metallo-beta-lactamase family protein
VSSTGAGALTLRFEGAARTVTGSRHRIQFGRHSWLFDCGLYQGHRDEAEAINRTFHFPPSDLNAVVLSHAHLDHSGNLPTLISQGYPGKIHVTPATGDLVRVLLPDTAFLMEREVDHVNWRTKGRRPPRRPLYTQAEVEETLERLADHPYHEPWELFPGVTVEYFDAGHILGSALTTFEIAGGGRKTRLGFTGDLGRPGRPILRDPETVPGVDVLVLESTYGDRLHTPSEETDRALADVVRRAVEKGGRLLIPSFAVGRTQEVVATLHRLTNDGIVPDLPIFVDSPMAKQATEVFRRHPECFDAATRRAFESNQGEPFGFARLRYVSTQDESRSLNDREGSFVVISASGMCEGGRILHHLKQGLGKRQNTVLLVGYQADGTLGRRLQDGAEVVNIFGEPVIRRAEVISLDGFSAHADQREILDWVAGLTPPPKRIFLVHGEEGPAEVLASLLRERVSADVRVPLAGEAFELWS